MPSYETLGMNRRLTDDQQAVSFASFGQANYPSGQQIYPGANGYYPGPQYQANMGVSPYYPHQPAPQPYAYGQSYYAPQPQPMYQQPLVGPAPQFYQGSGLGTPPAFQQPNSSPYNYGTSPNPAFQYMAQNPQYFQNNPYMQIQDVTYTIPPINPGGSEYLPPIGYEDEIDQMQLDYWREVQESHGKKAAQRIARDKGIFSDYDGYNMGGYNYNYYNSLYYNNDYNYNHYIDQKYRDKLNKMQEDARQRRIDLNIHLAKLAFNYLGMDYNEEALVEAYTGKTVTVPGITTLDLYKQQRFNNLVPFDNSEWYRQKDAEVTREFRKHVGEHDNMEQFFENIALVAIDDALKEEDHRRKGMLNEHYDSDGYRSLVRMKAAELEARKKGISLNPAYDLNVQFEQLTEEAKALRAEIMNPDNYPGLKSHATLSDDGTLNITYGYEPPKNAVMTDENTKKYQAEKERFRGFLESIPGAVVREEGMGI